jgi:hypothetical protein
VVELGCGPGLPSLAALKAGAPRVTATDWSRWALALVRHAADTFHPQQAACLRTACHDIFDPSAPLPPADYLVAADLCYEEETAEALGALVARHLFDARPAGGRAGSAIVADPNRLSGAGRAAFVRGLRSAGRGTAWERQAQHAASAATFVDERMPRPWRGTTMGVCVIHG